MRKANVEKIETMMAGFLQYRWRIYLVTKKMEEDGKIERPADTESPDFIFYQGACEMVESCGGNWRRNYNGKNTPEDLNNIDNYSHCVWLPDDETCSRLNVNAWDY